MGGLPGCWVGGFGVVLVPLNLGFGLVRYSFWFLGFGLSWDNFPSLVCGLDLDFGF